MYYTIVKATSSVCATDTQQLFGKKTQRERDIEKWSGTELFSNHKGTRYYVVFRNRNF